MTSPWFRPEEPKSAAEPLDGLGAGLRTIVLEKELDKEVKRLNKNKEKPRRYTLGDGLFVLITLVVIACVVASVSGILEDVVLQSSQEVRSCLLKRAQMIRNLSSPRRPTNSSRAYLTDQTTARNSGILHYARSIDFCARTHQQYHHHKLCFR